MVRLTRQALLVPPVVALAVATACQPDTPTALPSPAFEEICLYYPTEDPSDPGIDYCYDTDDPDPEAPGMYLAGWDDARCFWDIDSDQDQDGTDDGCESRLTYEFAPELLVAYDCNFDYGLNRQGGEYLYAARRMQISRKFGGFKTVMRIAYLPAYYTDCGNWDGDQGHDGDSEFIMLDLIYDSASRHWMTDGVYLSAHCGTITSACGWRDLSLFQWVDGKYRGAPEVWVSHGKHANYPTFDDCERGVWPLHDRVDFCASSPRIYRFPILVFPMEQNIGQRNAPLRDCTTPLARWQILGSTAPRDMNATECFWTDVRFRGWQRPASGDATAYSAILAERVGF